MKLANFPNSQSLQPLPAQAHADTSESVQRSATPADIQNVQNAAQAAPAPTYSADTTGYASDLTNGLPSFLSGSFTLWLVLALAILVAFGSVWLWRSFGE